MYTFIDDYFYITPDCWNCVYVRLFRTSEAMPREGACIRFPEIHEIKDLTMGCGEQKIDIHEINKQIKEQCLRFRKEIKEKNIKIKKLYQEKKLAKGG